MSDFNFSQLSVLVVDDFSSFRSTLMGMLSRLGIKKMEEAARPQEVFKLCSERTFDVILCDYNLGNGRNGQHILEELRFKNLIARQNLFLMVTAEAGKDMVLSAYDCEPDDYLTKPLNLKTLEQRLSRLVQQRNVLLPVYQLLEKQEFEVAIAELEQIVGQPGRHQLAAQKLLGQLYLECERLIDAEKLYRSNAQRRQLDWAQLGVAKVAIAKGELGEAQSQLEELVANSRLFLPARDALAQVYEQQRDLDSMLRCVQESVELSPRSLFRQRKLAKIAVEHGEIKQALDASLDTVKLGELSCHRDPKDSLSFLEALGNALEAGVDCGHLDVADEVKKCYGRLASDYELAAHTQAQAQLLTARVHALSGDSNKAQQLAEQASKYSSCVDNDDLEVSLAQYAYLVSVDDLPAANEIADRVIAAHGQGNRLDKLDKLLPEPKNERNRQRVAQLNKAGIDCYSKGEHDQALAYFRRATLMFPRHTGLQLNYLQTLVGKSKQQPQDRELDQKVKTQINKLKLLIPKTDAQYSRFAQLASGIGRLND